MPNFKLIFFTLLITNFLHFSTAASIPTEDLSKRQNFLHCLLDYLNDIGIISYASEHEESFFPDCQTFHVDLNKTMQKMYSVLKFNLETAINEPSETDCLMDIFRQSKFLEYNVIATTAMQLEREHFDKLERVLSTSKGIFVFACVRCLINQEMLAQIFSDFARKMTLTPVEFDCLERDVFERNLIERVYIRNMDEYFEEKFDETLTKFDNSRVLSNFADGVTSGTNSSSAIEEMSSVNEGDVTVMTTEESFETTPTTTMHPSTSIKFRSNEIQLENSEANSLSSKSAEIERISENSTDEPSTTEKHILKSFEFLDKTSEATTEIPSTTTEIPLTTTEIPLTTTQIPSTATKIHLETEAIQNMLQSIQMSIKELDQAFDLATVTTTEASLKTDLNLDYKDTIESNELKQKSESQEINSEDNQIEVLAKVEEVSEKNIEIQAQVQEVTGDDLEVQQNNSLRNSNPPFLISDSNIKKRDLSQKPIDCPIILDEVKLRMKRYNIDQFSPEDNQCMGENVSQQDIDDIFTFIVMKKTAQNEPAMDLRNKKMMNLVVSFIAKYVDCTDLYGLVNMVSINKDESGEFEEF